MMKISEKRKAGEVLGRGGISQRIQTLAKMAHAGRYKDAIEIAGQISVLVQASTFDEYWTEKANKGKHLEEARLQDLNSGHVKRDFLLCER